MLLQHRKNMLLLIVLPLTVFAQREADLDSCSNEELQAKYRLFTGFRNIGHSVLGGSAALLAVGIVTLSTAKPLPSHPDTSYTDVDFRQRVSGVVMTFTGSVLPAVGFPFAIVGIKKRREYRERMRLQGIQVSLELKRASFEAAFVF